MYYKFHDKLFENNAELAGASDVNALLAEWAGELGLDVDEFNECLESGKFTDEVKKDMDDGSAAGIKGTPGFIINGVPLSGAQPFAAFEKVIEAALNE